MVGNLLFYGVQLHARSVSDVYNLCKARVTSFLSELLLDGHC